MKISSPRVESIDTMRVIAILAVVMIHTTTRTLEVVHYDLINYPWTILFNQLSRFAVPLFFLISGFVLEVSSDRDTDYLTFLKKRFTKIFIPYIFWTLIYKYLVYTNNHDNLVHVLLTGNASYQLYFIPTLCIFYILFPLLHKIYKKIAHPVSLVILGAIQFWLLYQDYFVKHGGSDHPARIVALSFFVFLLGIVAARNKDKILAFTKKWKFFLITAAAFSGYYVFNEGRNFYYQIYNIGAIYSQFRPSVLIYTTLTGLSLYSILDKINMRRFSELSYFVFFVHVVILEISWKLFSKFVVSNPIFDLALFLTVSAASFLIAYLAHKIPYLSKITG